MGNCIRNTDRRWLNGIVPYRIDDVSADIVARAINAWADADVGVRFVPYTGPTDPGRAGPHIVFAPGGEAAPCTSKIGRVGVGQRINCDLRESRLDTLIHEIGHALGLQHEHQRFDRGNHVAVIEDNIVAGYRFAYDRLSIDDGLPHGPYDFDSIMHYPESQFAVDFTVNVDVPGLSTPHPPALALFGDELHIVVTDPTGICGTPAPAIYGPFRLGSSRDRAARRRRCWPPSTGSCSSSTSVGPLTMCGSATQATGGRSAATNGSRG